MMSPDYLKLYVGSSNVTLVDSLQHCEAEQMKAHQ